MSLEIPTALERRIEIRTEFYHESQKFRNAISSAMREFVGDRIDILLDEFNATPDTYEVTDTELAVVQPAE